MGWKGVIHCQIEGGKIWKTELVGKFKLKNKQKAQGKSKWEIKLNKEN